MTVSCSQHLRSGRPGEVFGHSMENPKKEPGELGGTDMSLLPGKKGKTSSSSGKGIEGRRQLSTRHGIRNIPGRHYVIR